MGDRKETCTHTSESPRMGAFSSSENQSFEPRKMCYVCFWPQKHCFCGDLKKISTKTYFVFLMHPKEFKKEKAGTGRLTHLSLPSSEIIMGLNFSKNKRVQEIIEDPNHFCALLYPGQNSLNLSQDQLPPEFSSDKRLVVFILDATWAMAKKMLKISGNLQKLPRLMFTPTEKSQFRIKQQPHEWCLSTLETTHQLLITLSKRDLDSYVDQEYLLQLFQKMQDIQLAYASDPHQQGYRHRPFKKPEDRKTKKLHQSSGRNLFFVD